MKIGKPSLGGRIRPGARADQAPAQPTAPVQNGAAAPPATAAAAPPASAPADALNAAYGKDFVVDLERRRDQLTARVAELQWDLGGLVYEMAIRNGIRVDVLVKRAAALQDADAELSEVERILRMEQTGTAGACASCGAPHSQRRRLLLAVRPAAARAGLGRRDPASLQPKRR